MSSNFGFNIGKMNPNNTDNNASTLKGGVRKESVDQKFHSIFDKVDRDKNGILDETEFKNFNNEVSSNHNDKNEAIVYGWIKNKDKKLVQKQYTKLQDLPEGRSLVADNNGKQWVMSKDGVILKESYAKYDTNTGRVNINQQQKKLINGRNITSKIEQENRYAKAIFDKQMKEDGIFEDIADGVSAAWGSDNRASVVREDFKKLDSGLKKMNLCLKRQDIHGFEDAFEQTYGVKYNEKNINEYYKDPTPENRKKAFGDSRISDIRARVIDYNESQKAGGAVVKGVTIATTAAVTGGASVAGFAVASGVAAVGADVIDDLSKGEGHKDFSLKENASHLTDKENLIKYGKDGLTSAGSAYLGGQIGKVAGKFIGNKIFNPKFEKVIAENTTKYGEHLYINAEGAQILQNANKLANIAEKTGGYVADSSSSSIAEATTETVAGASFGESLGVSASGVIGDGIAEGGKKIVKNIVKKSI